MSVAASASRPSALMFGLSPDRLFVVLSRLVALTALIVTLSILSPHFLTWNNLINVLRHAVPLFIMSAGLTLVVLTAGIDLSVGAVLGLSACLAASLIAGGHPGLGIAAALGAGLACGLVNGVLVSYARIPSFIATYGMLWIANGMAYVFMQGEVIYGLPAGFRTHRHRHARPDPGADPDHAGDAADPARHHAPDAVRRRRLRHRRQPGGGAAVRHAGAAARWSSCTR